MANPNDLAQGTSSTAVNPTNYNIIIDRINELGNRVYDVTDYGATGDGATNDITAITAAITAATVAGGIVYFPVGVYKVASVITVPSNVMLVGAGMHVSKIIPSATMTNIITITASANNVGIYDLWVYGTGTMSTTERGFYSDTGTDIKVERCRFENMTFGVHFATVTRGSVKGCVFYAIVGTASTSEGYGVLASLGCSQIITSGNQFKTIARHAVYYSSGTSDSIISDNVINDTGETGIAIYATNTQDTMNNISVTGNVVKDVDSAAQNGHGIAMTGNVRNLHIADNEIIDAKTTGVYVQAGGYDDAAKMPIGITIVNNTIKDIGSGTPVSNYGNGIHILGGQKVAIIGNRIYNTNEYGISVAYAAGALADTIIDSVFVADNLIDTAVDTGIRAIVSAATANIVIGDNEILNCGNDYVNMVTTETTAITMIKIPWNLRFTISDGVTLTFTYGFSITDLLQHFARTTTGTIAFGTGYVPELQKEWFGGNLALAWMLSISTVGASGPNYYGNRAFQDDLTTMDLTACALLDGTNHYFSAGNVLNGGTADISLSAWVKTTTSDTYRIVAGKGSYGNSLKNYFITFETGVPYFVYNDGTLTSAASRHSSGVNCADGYWHHVAATWDRDGNLAGYVDSVPAGTWAINATDNDNALAFEVGRDAGAGGKKWAGSIQDVRVYIAAGDHWSAAAIAAQYAARMDTSSGESLTSSWLFDDSPLATVIDDAQVAANNLTLVGGTTTNFYTHTKAGGTGLITVDNTGKVITTKGAMTISGLDATFNGDVVVDGTISMSTPYEDVYYVAISGGDYTSIQTALTAHSDGGEVFLVAPGSYTDTINFSASNQTVRGIGTTSSVTVSQADAAVVNFGAHTGCSIADLKITMSAPTTALDMITGSGTLSLRDCHQTVTSAAALAQLQQPSCIYTTGTVKVVRGTMTYNNSGVCAGGIKAPVRLGASGAVELRRVTIDVDGSNAAQATTVAYEAAGVTAECTKYRCTVNIDDTTATVVAGFGYLVGTGTSHEVLGNNVHITVGAGNTGYGYYLDGTSTVRSMYNHIEVTDAGGNSYSYMVDAGCTLISQFDDIVAADGTGTINGTVTKANSESDGELSLTGDIIAAGGFRKPFTFIQSDVAASQTAVAIDVAGLVGNTEVVMPYAGSVIAITVASNDARTAGTLTVDATINGAATGLQAVLDDDPTTYAYTVQAKDTDAIAAGDRLGVKITTDAGWLPVTADILVTVEVEG